MIVKGTTHDLTLTSMPTRGQELEAFDNTKWSAINTCPTWGITRYQMHLRMPGAGRALALEAGHALHEVFAWVRLATLADQCQDRQGLEFATEVISFHGKRLFGIERLKHINEQVLNATDLPDVCKRGAIAVLDTSGYYDDPRDKRRTLSNMEESAYAYINRWRWDHPIWMRDPTDPTADVGIEIPFELYATLANTVGPSEQFEFRFVGRIDGIHTDGSGRLTVHDNKTASRLSDTWSQAQMTSHQYTGYCVAASHFTQQLVSRCQVLGLALPQPRSYDFGGFATESMDRHDYHVRRWVDWIVHTMRIARIYANDPINAPKYTHSCNRYFRACVLIPFCYGDDDEQNRILGEMELDEWSPLDKSVLDGVGSE
jgi:hypothetical protein